MRRHPGAERIRAIRRLGRRGGSESSGQFVGTGGQLLVARSSSSRATIPRARVPRQGFGERIVSRRRIPPAEILALWRTSHRPRPRYPRRRHRRRRPFAPDRGSGREVCGSPRAGRGSGARSPPLMTESSGVAGCARHTAEWTVPAGSTRRCGGRPPPMPSSFERRRAPTAARRHPRSHRRIGSRGLPVRSLTTLGSRSGPFQERLAQERDKAAVEPFSAVQRISRRQRN